MSLPPSAPSSGASGLPGLSGTRIPAAPGSDGIGHDGEKNHRPHGSWNPRTFVRRRRLRVLVSMLLTLAVCLAGFLLNTRKAVALEINGQKKEVVTYASSVPAFLSEQGVKVRTHDQVTSTSGQWLADGATVRVRQAYQLTLSIDGVLVPYWTTTDSAAKIASFYDSSRKDAAKLTVNITNVYNRLTGGISINRDGPVLVRWDGKESVAPDGRLTAASILDSKGITLGKNDRVSVSVENGRTVLTVQRVKYRTIARTVSIPYSTSQVEDPNLAAGTTKVVTEGKDGTKSQTVRQTLVDGAVASEQILSSTTTSQPVERVVAVGTKQPEPSTGGSDGNASSGSGSSASSSSGPGGPSSSGSSSGSGGSSSSGTSDSGSANSGSQSGQGSGQSSGNTGGNSGQSQAGGTTGNSGQGQTTPTTPTQPSKPVQPTQPTQPTTGGGLTPAQAQAYARIAARDQYGWGDDQFGCLVTLWNHESNWRYTAENPSGAYGIPQLLPSAHNMPANYRTDAAVQVNWGLSYISGRYGNPCNAWSVWQKQHWY